MRKFLLGAVLALSLIALEPLIASAQYSSFAQSSSFQSFASSGGSCGNVGANFFLTPAFTTFAVPNNAAFFLSNGAGFGNFASFNSGFRGFRGRGIGFNAGFNAASAGAGGQTIQNIDNSINGGFAARKAARAAARASRRGR